MAKISVIVPIYKAEQYLRPCVDSILSQTFEDLELLLVDDGSPDCSGMFCDEYASKDPRVRVIHKKNGGVSTARNAGLDAASGEYITFVDSDDYIDRDMYAAMMELADRGVDLVMCDCVKEFADHQQLYTHNIRQGFYDRVQLKEEYFPHLLMMENVEYPTTISNCLLLFRRELAENVRYLQGVRYSEDLLFGAQLIYRARSFFYMKGKPYYHYRINEQSATHKFVSDKWTDYKKLHQGIVDAFGNCVEFDFSKQIDLCLLFFIYNTVGHFAGEKSLPVKQRKKMILDVLSDVEVQAMFARTDISALLISPKLKLLTYLYKKRVAIGLLCRYLER